MTSPLSTASVPAADVPFIQSPALASTTSLPEAPEAQTEPINPPPDGEPQPPEGESAAATNLAEPALVEDAAAPVTEAAPAPEVVPASAAAVPDVFKQTAHGWEMVFAGRRSSVFGNVKGFGLIRTLLENPNCPIDSMTLMRSESVEAVAKVDPKTGRVELPPENAEQVEVTATDGFDGVEAFDPRARQEYLRDVQRLRDEERELRHRGNESAADRCRNDAEEIVDHLRRESDRHGRPRTTGSDLERARKAAYARFARALDQVADALPDLAAHLREAVRTGRAYVYQVPDDTRWVTR